MMWMAMVAMSVGIPGAALADPCEGRLPQSPGDRFSGRVRYVGDGDGLCVGTSPDPSTWIEVRLSDFDAPELNRTGGRDARQRLSELTLGQTVQCVTARGRTGRHITYDRVIAACSLRGRGLGDHLRALGGREDGH